jgi:CMP-N,N'-diacetyllegionaminic acid synthase
LWRLFIFRGGFNHHLSLGLKNDCKSIQIPFARVEHTAVTVVGVIPARGGSQRLPGKNIRPCAGKPLLNWTCEAALSAHSLDRVVLSTDDENIAALGRACGVEVPFLRPSHLATGDAPMLPVLSHLLSWLEIQTSVVAVVLLQPTSPLRISEDIDKSVELLLNKQADSIVTVTSVPSSYSITKLMERNQHNEVRSAKLDLSTRNPMVMRNGPAVLVVRPEVIRTGTLYGKKTLCYEMPQERSIDIDTPFDFLMAELLLEHRQRASAGDDTC